MASEKRLNDRRMRLKVCTHRKRREFAPALQCHRQEQLIGQTSASSNRSRQIGTGALYHEETVGSLVGELPIPAQRRRIVSSFSTVDLVGFSLLCKHCW